MSLNLCAIEGRLPFDIEVKNEGEKNAFVGSKVSVKRSYKPEGEKYYPEDLLSFKAYGPKADFIGKYFPKGKSIGLKGELRVADDWTDKEGNEHKGEMYINVTDVFFPEGGSKSESSSDDEEPKSKSASKPAAAKKSTNPLLAGKKGAPWGK